MAHVSKEIFDTGEYFRFHIRDVSNLGLVSEGNESLNATVNVYVNLIGLRYWLDVGAGINNKRRERCLEFS